MVGETQAVKQERARPRRPASRESLQRHSKVPGSARRPRGRWPMRRCAWCGEPFIDQRTRRDRLTCSSTCRVALHRQRQRAKTGEVEVATPTGLDKASTTAVRVTSGLGPPPTRPPRDLHATGDQRSPGRCRVPRFGVPAVTECRRGLPSSAITHIDTARQQGPPTRG
jgi:predicted nucleic acid-binding Zn ribbon protein